MNKKIINIAFMGTPEFAVPALSKLSEIEKYNIKAIYTQSDKPFGRKQVLTPPPVKVFAQSKNIPVFQPEKIRKNTEIIDHLKSLDLDFIVVVAYGKILPQSILDIPKLGCINIHGSLLEKYRGAAPIQWAIANGETETGITTMLLDAGMDTGDTLLKESIKIELNDTTETLSKKLSLLGSDLLIKTLDGLLDNSITPIKQDNDKATNAPMINKNDGEIDWSNTSSQIYNKCRAFTPWPSIYTFYNNVTLKVTGCSLITDIPDRSYKDGQVIEINKSGIVVSTGEGNLLLTKVQLSGSKEMNAVDFARGQRLEEGHIFSNVVYC
ncbi:MAG: methionyl-tRNA formyltransferase [Candidatus Sericytochromatia bacterium]|nr:methionyl-tRNA formyltransferase [Candidatus Sericytochromatia bacterium]